MLPSSLCDYTDEIYSMEITPNDVLLLSQPGTGTSLPCEMVWNICNDVDTTTAKKLPLTDRWQFIDASSSLRRQLSEISASPRPCGSCERRQSVAPPTQSRRFIMSHMPLSLLPRHLLDVCKVVYITQKPVKSNAKDTPDFTKFLRSYLQEGAQCDPYWSQHSETKSLRNHPNLIILCQEDIEAAPCATIHKVATFFNTSISMQQVNTLVNHLIFDNTHNKPSMNGEQMSKTVSNKKNVYPFEARFCKWTQTIKTERCPVGMVM